MGGIPPVICRDALAGFPGAEAGCSRRSNKRRRSYIICNRGPGRNVEKTVVAGTADRVGIKRWLLSRYCVKRAVEEANNDGDWTPAWYVGRMERKPRPTTMVDWASIARRHLCDDSHGWDVHGGDFKASRSTSVTRLRT